MNNPDLYVCAGWGTERHLCNDPVKPTLVSGQIHLFCSACFDRCNNDHKARVEGKIDTVQSMLPSGTPDTLARAMSALILIAAGEDVSMTPAQAQSIIDLLGNIEKKFRRS